MPTRRTTKAKYLTKAEALDKLTWHWRRLFRKNHLAFAAGVCYGLRCARDPGRHLDNARIGSREDQR
jgi:hypothetical protein